MKPVSAAIAAFTEQDISRLEKDGEITIMVESEPLVLQVGEVDISAEDIPGWSVASKGPLTVALDITIT